MIGIELKKMLRSRNARLIFMIGIFLAVCQTVYYRFWYYPGEMLNFETALQGGKTGGYIQPPVLTQGWLGTDFTSLWEHFFYLTLPMLAAVPWADSYYTEKRNGYLKMVYTKTSRMRYLLSKYVVAFLSGTAAIAIPLLVSLYFSVLYLPAKPLDAVMFQSAITNQSLWNQEFFTVPVLFILKYIGMDAFYGGLFAVTSLLLSFFLKSRFNVWSILFILNIVGYYILFSFKEGLYKFIPYFFLNASVGAPMTSGFLLIMGSVVLVVSLAGFLYLGKKDEIF